MYGCVTILSKIEPLAVIGSLICICAICHLSRNDKFERKYVGDLSLYFYDAPNATNINNIHNIITKAKLFKRRKIEEIILKNNIKGYTAKNKNKLFLRKLVDLSFCRKTRFKFEQNKGKKLSKIFDCKINKIHRLSIGLIVIMFLPIFVNIITIIYIKVNRYSTRRIINAIRCHFCIAICGLITNLVLLIIIGVTYNKGDIGEFNDFLDCPGVNKKYFDNFSDVTKLRKYFIAFEVLDSIFEVIKTLLEVVNASEEFEEEAKQIKRNILGYGIY